MILIKTFEFDPKNVIMKDDAVHKNKIFGNVETWYYDAIFDNKYSMVCLINLIRFLKKGLILTGLFIYKDTKLIKSFRDRTSIKNLSSSEERPYIVIKDKEIIDARIQGNSNNWFYHISMGDQINNVNLEFVKKLKPWMGNHYMGSWLVIPKLEVNGNITIDGKKVNVTGHGYHDHNNYSLFSPFFNKGANFGKISAGPINVVWAQVIKNKNNVKNIVVINKDQKFISIPSENIKLSIEDSIKEHGKIVPTKYLLKVEKQDIYVNVKIESINYHFLTIPFVKYWRHHAKNTGKISYNSIEKDVDDIEIIDQLTFM